MSSARQRASALRRRDQPEPEPERSETPREAPDKVRQTVDLTYAQHAGLAAWRMETALALGRTRLTTQDTLVAAVRAILADPTVARRVRAVLEEDDTL